MHESNEQSPFFLSLGEDSLHVNIMDVSGSVSSLKKIILNNNRVLYTQDNPQISHRLFLQRWNRSTATCCRDNERQLG